MSRFGAWWHSCSSLPNARLPPTTSSPVAAAGATTPRSPAFRRDLLPHRAHSGVQRSRSRAPVVHPGQDCSDRRMGTQHIGHQQFRFASDALTVAHTGRDGKSPVGWSTPSAGSQGHRGRIGADRRVLADSASRPSRGKHWDSLAARAPHLVGTLRRYLTQITVSMRPGSVALIDTPCDTSRSTSPTTTPRSLRQRILRCHSTSRSALHTARDRVVRQRGRPPTCDAYAARPPDCSATETARGPPSWTAATKRSAKPAPTSPPARSTARG